MPRGGARAGAGRKTMTEQSKRVQVSISVSPETKAKIDQLRKRNVKVGQLVDDLLRNYLDCPEK